MEQHLSPPTHPPRLRTGTALAAALLLIGVLAGPAAAGPPARRAGDAQAQVLSKRRDGTARPSDPQARCGLRKLPPGTSRTPAEPLLARWLRRSVAPDTRRALLKLIASGVRGAATFDADGTLWKDDVGEGFFQWMMQNRYYPSQRFPMLEAAWHDYKAGTLEPTKMYELMVTGMAGMREEDVSRLARRYFDNHHKATIYRPMAMLVSALSETGFRPWVVSGSPFWVVAAGARHFGIAQNSVIGLKVRVDAQGRLTDEVIRPVPWEEGKARRILEELREPPVIAAGNSRGDLQMLRIASMLPLGINPEADLVSDAKRLSWCVNRFGAADTLGHWRGRRNVVLRTSGLFPRLAAPLSAPPISAPPSL